MSNILEIKALRKEYKGFVLNDVSLKLPYGYIMGLIGPNGAGKTTIIKLIMNLVRRSSGSISLFGKDNLEYEVEVKDRIGFVYDSQCFYENMSLERVKNIIAPFYSKWNNDVFYSYIKTFRLPLKKTFRQISKGMYTKFALAVALSHGAELLILDEPTSGLDPIFRRELLEILSELIFDGSKSVIFSTHITTDLERISDYITFVNDGEIVFSDTKEEIMSSWVTVKGGSNLLNENNKGILRGVRKNSSDFEGVSDSRERVKEAFMDQVYVGNASIEDIMFYVLGGRGNGKNIEL